MTGLEDFLPQDLLTQPAANGGYYRNPTTYPPTFTSPIRNAKKFDHCWCYEGVIPGVDGTGQGEPKGYNFNCYKFADAGSNVLKTRLYAFLQAIQERYENDEVFAGIVTTEAATGNPLMEYEEGNGRDPHYEGRFNIAKQMRATFVNRIVIECVNFDLKYVRDLTNAGVIDGLIANKLGYTNANIHLGTNMHFSNIRRGPAGKLPIVMQIQPLDMRSKTGNRPQYYNWPTNPNQVLSGGGVDYNDPAPMQFLFDRLIYYKANLSIYQRNFLAGSPNWETWKTFMDNGPNADDEYGGLDRTKPQFVA